MSPSQLPDVHDAPPPVVAGEPAEVADGVFVLADQRVPLVPNVGIVLGSRSALVVDTGLGPANGARVLDVARELAGDRPLFLTITHFHPEHGFGASAFRGAATIVYNRAQRDELRRKGAGYLEMFRGFGPDVVAGLADVEFVDPDIAYDTRLELDLGGRQVVLESVGPAHSAGDQLVFVDDRVLFAGDLLETRMFPIAPYFPPHDTDFDGGRWIAILDRLAGLAPAVVVPGHGGINDVTLIHDVREYLAYVQSEVARLQDVSADEAAAMIEKAARDRWPTWSNPEWIGYAARAFHASC